MLKACGKPNPANEVKQLKFVGDPAAALEILRDVPRFSRVSTMTAVGQRGLATNVLVKGASARETGWRGKSEEVAKSTVKYAAVMGPHARYAIVAPPYGRREGKFVAAKLAFHTIRQYDQAFQQKLIRATRPERDILMAREARSAELFAVLHHYLLEPSKKAAKAVTAFAQNAANEGVRSSDHDERVGRAYAHRIFHGAIPTDIAPFLKKLLVGEPKTSAELETAVMEIAGTEDRAELDEIR